MSAHLPSICTQTSHINLTNKLRALLTTFLINHVAPFSTAGISVVSVYFIPCAFLFLISCINNDTCEEVGSGTQPVPIILCCKEMLRSSQICPGDLDHTNCSRLVCTVIKSGGKVVASLISSKIQ